MFEFEQEIQSLSGELFEKLEENRAPETKATPEDFQKLEALPEEDESKDIETEKIPSYEEQLSFTLHGFVFNLSDHDQISELKSLIDLLKVAETGVRKEVNDTVFSCIQDILTEKFLK